MAERRRRDVLIWSATIAVMALILLAPALWNGFPLIYPDTGGYLERPLLGTLEMGRSALYGAFLLAGAPLSFLAEHRHPGAHHGVADFSRSPRP